MPHWRSLSKSLLLTANALSSRLMCSVNYQVLVRGWLGSISLRAIETYGIWWEENFLQELEVSKNTMIANSSQDAKFKKQLDGGTNCAGKSNSTCTVLSQHLQIGRWVEFSPVEKQKASAPLRCCCLCAAHRGLINELFKRVAITLQPRRAASFCSTNWRAGAVLTLPLAWLAWELQHPKASLVGRLCCKPHLLQEGTEDALEGSSWEPGAVFSHLPSHQVTLTELAAGGRAQPLCLYPGRLKRALTLSPSLFLFPFYGSR